MRGTTSVVGTSETHTTQKNVVGRRNSILEQMYCQVNRASSTQVPVASENEEDASSASSEVKRF